MNRTKPEIQKDKHSIPEILSRVPKPKGFIEFLSQQTIMTLALGVIIGQATRDTVNALVSGILTPAIQLLIPNVKLQNLVINVGNAKFMIGTFLNALIEMLLILLILYFVFVVILKRGEFIGAKKANTNNSTQK